MKEFRDWSKEFMPWFESLSKKIKDEEKKEFMMVIQMDESFFWHDFPKETIKKLAEEKKINPEIKPSNKQLNEISDDIKILLKSQKIPFLFLSDSVINKKWGVRKVKYNEENLPLYQKAIEKKIEQDKSHKLSVYNFEYGKSKLFGEEEPALPVDCSILSNALKATKNKDTFDAYKMFLIFWGERDKMFCSKLPLDLQQVYQRVVWGQES